MVKIFTCISMLVCMFTAQIVVAQTKPDSLDLEVTKKKNQIQTEKETGVVIPTDSAAEETTIEKLEKEKAQIVIDEKAKLTETVKAILEKQEQGEITAEEAQQQKEAAARQAALNIENKRAIIENRIELAKRGETVEVATTKVEDDIIRPDDEKRRIFGITYYTSNYHKKIKYDRRTYGEIILALGLNNSLIKGKGLDGTPYRIGESRFFEMGYLWSSRVFDSTNAVRFKYGVMLQFNGLNPDNNMYFVRDGDDTYLEEHPYSLRKSKLRMDNLVLPVFLEFGPSKRVDNETYFRYRTNHRFRFAIGAYAGLNYSTRQKLKYKVDGDRVKDKLKNDYNTNNVVYGVASYIGFGGTSLYAKYDLNPLFHNADVKEHNVSLGIRFSID